ncbi:MAG: phosphoribosylamine--glycine ligase [Dehalococcoidales bacterium]|nr:phosphoribosylamine--glycine ligase [Dehalococcoidales bacterium]
MKVLVVGSGAREHTLVWKLSQSPRVDEIYAAPGNAGTGRIALNLDIKAVDFEGLAAAVREKHIDLIVVGPEDPLASGIVDYFKKIEIPIFGPSRAAARIESSKAFSKALMQKYDIPCARSQTFSKISAAVDYIRQQGAPLVIKADGLAAGKGVIMAETMEEALDSLKRMMESRDFGQAGETVIIEEKLTGREMSYFSITDGRNILPMIPACDYKRVFDGDRGLNTGGMGSYSPPFFTTPELEQRILGTIVSPTIRAMEEEGCPYQGVLYSGLMVKDGDAKVIEFNCRLGDPECQVILPRLKSDLMDIILGTVNSNLKDITPRWSSQACVGVALASGGYPSGYRTGFPISGLDDLDKEILVFHAGTKTGSRPGEVLTSGGRVLTIVALGDTTDEAREKIYASLPLIHFEGVHYRKDIALFKK